MKLKAILVIIFAGMFMFSCSSTEETTEDLPGWYTNPPSADNEYMYAIGEATSSRRSIARKQALQGGRAQLATKMQSEVQAMQKSYSEEVTSGDESNYSEVFTDVSKTVAEQKMSGVEVDKAKFYTEEDGTKHRVIMLVRLPIGEAANSLNQALSNALSKEEEMYTKFKQSKAFEEMQKSIEGMKEGEMPSEEDN